MRAGADHEEQPVGVDRLLAAAGAVAQHEVLEPAVAAAADDLGADPDVELRRRLDLVHEVLRHPRVERLRPHDERDAPGVPGEVQRRLAGGVRAADDVDLAARHGRRLGARCRRRRRRRRSAPRARGCRAAGTWRRWRAARRRGRATRPLSERVTVELAVLAPEVGDALQEGEVRAEDPGLLVRLCASRRPLTPRGKPR